MNRAIIVILAVAVLGFGLISQSYRVDSIARAEKQTNCVKTMLALNRYNADFVSEDYKDQPMLGLVTAINGTIDLCNELN